MNIDNTLAKIESVVLGALPSEPTFLMEPLKDMIRRGGKRWRPLLAHLVCAASGGGEAALPLLSAIEWTHTASLIHDDIEDSSPERRGKPACHILHGLDTALNAGAYLYFLAGSVIEKEAKGDAARAALYSAWINCVLQLHKGQAYDIYWHSHFDIFPSVDDYLAMCAGKTGALSEFAVHLGLLAAGGALTMEENALLPFARDAGVAFQIFDDVKNLKNAVHGKTPYDDFIEGKKSLPLLYYMEENGERKKEIGAVFKTASSTNPDMSLIDSLLRNMSGSIEKARRKGAAILDNALVHFEKHAWKEKDAFFEIQKLLNSTRV